MMICACLCTHGLFLCVLIAVKLVGTAHVRVDSPLVVLKGEIAVMKFQVVIEKGDTDDLKMMSIRCGFNKDAYDSTTMMLDGNDAAFNLYYDNASKSRYAGRLKPSTVTSDAKFITSYLIELWNCTYADEAMFGCTYQFRLSETTLSVARTVAIALQVEGPPENCPRSLPAKIDPQRGDRPKFIVDICGNPKPTVLLSFAGKPILDFRFENASERTSYKYHLEFQLPELSMEMCGEKLAYIAGNKRGQLVDQMVVELKPKPGIVSNIEGQIVLDKYANETCLEYLHWKSADVGKCASTYIIRINGGDYSETFETNVTHIVDKCFSSFKIANITGVEVQAYLPVSGEIGPANGAAVLSYFVQEVKPTSSMRTPSGEGSTGGDDSIIIIIGAALAGVVLLLVVLGIACCFKRRRKGYLEEILVGPSAPPVYSAVYVEPDYEEASSVLSSPKELAKPEVDIPPVVYESPPERPREQLLYADLGPTGARPDEHKPAQGNLYAEVKTDELGFPVVGDVLEEHPAERDAHERHPWPLQSKHLRKGEKKPGDFDVEMVPFTLKDEKELNESDLDA